MADVKYYVSQQNGSDANTGLSAANAWKTLAYAMANIPATTAGNTIHVYIGPGTYRERVLPTNDGYDANSKIYFCGDPNCAYLTNDAPGKVRITGCDANEQPTNGRVLDWSGKSFVELWDVYVDGSLNDFACYCIPVMRRVKASGYGGIYVLSNHFLYNCEAIGAQYGIYVYGNGLANGIGRCFGCIAVGGYYGFYLYGSSASATYNYMYLYNCVALGGQVAFSVTGGSSTYYNKGEVHNCVAVGAYIGFASSASYGDALFNCIAVGCRTAFSGSPYTYNCSALYCYTPGFDTSSFNDGELFANTSSASQILKQITPRLKAFISEFDYLFGLKKYGYGHNTTLAAAASYGSTMTLASERLVPFTPAFTGKSIGVQIKISSLPASGNITVELQKYVNSVWTTQKSKTSAAENLSVVGDGINYFEWDTTVNSGDNALTAVASTWRYRITGDTNGAATVICGSSTTLPSVIGNYIPDFITSDIEGKTIYGSILQGASDVPSVVLDSSLYQTAAPSIKFTGCGEKVLKLPVKKNVAVTVTYQARHDGAASGSTPKLLLKHKDITTQMVAHSAGANTWQALTATITPTFDGVIDVVLASCDPLKNAWFSDPAVS